MITQENYQDFTNETRPASARAGRLVQVVLNRIKLDSRYYYDLIQVLENKEYYSSILRKIHEHPHDISLQRRPLSSESQHHSDEESQSEEDESSDDVQASQVQCEGESSPKAEQEWVKSVGPCQPILVRSFHTYNVIL